MVRLKTIRGETPQSSCDKTGLFQKPSRAAGHLGERLAERENLRQNIRLERRGYDFAEFVILGVVEFHAFVFVVYEDQRDGEFFIPDRLLDRGVL